MRDQQDSCTQGLLLHIIDHVQLNASLFHYTPAASRLHSRKLILFNVFGKTMSFVFNIKHNISNKLAIKQLR